jgi:hypothetical protein
LKRLRRQATLTLITVGEDETRIMSKLRESPPPYDDVIRDYSDNDDDGSDDLDSFTIVVPNHVLSGNSRVAPLSSSTTPAGAGGGGDHRNGYTLCGIKVGNILASRPVMKLFLVITLNGLVSMAFAAMFVEVQF